MPRHDPFTGLNFRVEIDGVAVAAFAECSGLSSETDVIEYREGADRTSTPRLLPGLTHYGPIVMRRGVTGNRDLWNWRQTVVDGNVQRLNGSVLLLDAEGNLVVRWNFFEAWPRKWEGPALRARGNEVAIETLEIVCERIELA
jgi:phage tail-like protein